MTNFTNNRLKALSAFKKLGAAVFITATTLMLAMFFTACNQTGNKGEGGGKPKPKHAITFSVDGANGKLKAKADDVIETEVSPIKVEEGKIVTFMATANGGYRVKGWTLDGSPISEAGTKIEYKFTVTKPAIVKVSFEAIPKHAITFSVDGANGKLKAKADGVDETSTSPITVEEGKTVTFTATANDGYRVKSWILDGSPISEAGTKTEYKFTVTKPAIVKVSFEPIPATKYTVTLTQTEHGTVTASPAIPADGKVAEGTEIIFTAKADACYKIDTWVISPSTALKSGGNKGNETATLKINSDTTVSVNFKPLPQGKAILTLDSSKKVINVEAKTADGSAIQVEGCNEQILASGVETKLHAKGATVTLKGYITELYCKENQLTALDVQGLTSLQELVCFQNQLTTLGVQGCTALQKLECHYNQLKSLDVQGLTSLQELTCPSNQLTTLNVQGLTTLEKLTCSYNRLTELNVQGCASLKNLSCNQNKLSTINVSGLTSLQEFKCNKNKLTALNVQGCTALRMLECKENKLAVLNMQGCSALKALECYGNKLNAQAMTEVLKALQARAVGDDAWAYLYSEKTDILEDNCKDFSTPEDLKKAFDEAKDRNWKLKKQKTDGSWVEI